MLWEAEGWAVSLPGPLLSGAPHPCPGASSPTHWTVSFLSSKPHRCFPELLHVYWVSLLKPLS